MKIVITPIDIFKKLLIFISILLIANIISIIHSFNSDNSNIKRILRMFIFDAEISLPTIYSTVALITCSILLFLIALSYKNERKKYLPWLGLGVVFLFLSIDEIASIHERAIPVFRNEFDLSGVFYFSWIIPYGIGLIIFLMLYVPFLIKLPRQTMKWFILSGAIFVSGAIGVEFLEGIHVETNGFGSPYYTVLYTVEESLEMIGIAFFIYTLMTYMSRYTKKINIEMIE